VEEIKKEDVNSKEDVKPQPAASAASAEAQAKAPKPQSRMNRALQRGFRWLLGFLIVAGLGALLVIFTLYLPLRQSLGQSQAEVEQMKQQVAELEGDIDRFSPLETENQDLQAELDQSSLHIALLTTRADIATAQVALAQEDPEAARLALKDTARTLRSMVSKLKPEDKDLVTNLLARLDLALKGIGENNYAAASDLDVLATGLVELEKTYFPGP